MPIVETYPCPHTGEVVDISHHAGYQQYGDHFSTQSTNIYAPFKFKLDWNITRWAKLHGPSLTAATELLSIDGVSFIFYLFTFIVIMKILATRHIGFIIQEYKRTKYHC
jgi:hypothetical protein